MKEKKWTNKERCLYILTKLIKFSESTGLAVKLSENISKQPKFAETVNYLLFDPDFHLIITRKVNMVFLNNTIDYFPREYNNMKKIPTNHYQIHLVVITMIWVIFKNKKYNSTLGNIILSFLIASLYFSNIWSQLSTITIKKCPYLPWLLEFFQMIFQLFIVKNIYANLRIPNN